MRLVLYPSKIIDHCVSKWINYKYKILWQPLSLDNILVFKMEAYNSIRDLVFERLSDKKWLSCMSENHTYLLDNDYSGKETEDPSIGQHNWPAVQSICTVCRTKKKICPMYYSVNFNLADDDNRNMISYETDENSIHVNRMLS